MSSPVWMIRWWPRLLGVLLTIAFVLPSSARACPTKQAVSCCCCKHDRVDAPEGPALERVPCCSSDTSEADTLAVVEDVEPTPGFALVSEEDPRPLLLHRAPHAMLAQPRARGPPEALLYKHNCSYLL